MAIDWVAALREQDDLVGRVSRETRNALDRPDLTLDQAKRICGLVEMGMNTFEQFIDSATGQNLSPGYYVAAQVLTDRWYALALDASSRLQIMEERKP